MKNFARPYNQDARIFQRLDVSRDHLISLYLNFISKDESTLAIATGFRYSIQCLPSRYNFAIYRNCRQTIATCSVHCTADHQNQSKRAVPRRSFVAANVVSCRETRSGEENRRRRRASRSRSRALSGGNKKKKKGKESGIAKSEEET